MQVLSRARRLAPALRQPRLLFSGTPSEASQSPKRSTDVLSGIHHNRGLPCYTIQSVASSWTMMQKSFYSSETTTSVIPGNSTDSVKEIYDKIFKSVVEKRTMSPNAWLWSLMETCANRDDIKLLFDMLQRLRVFRLSNLRIHENFNESLCREVTKACVRVGAIDYGKKTLSKHNLFGISPSIPSAHHLLMYAKQKDDVKLMEDVMKLIKRNDLPLQPGTADIVFSICSNTDSWELISKYAKRFIKGGVKLRRTSFDTWMDFAAKRGDVDSLWKIDTLRSETTKQHTLVSVFSCSKGMLLENKPQEAATLIQSLNQILPDSKKPDIMLELQKLVNNWPLDVIKRQEDDEHRKALAVALQNTITTMLSSLTGMGVKADVKMEDLTQKVAILG
ncbi:uncharacterized protein LOC124934311 isoform X2 [Impatiens glandulifera]|uniref:uncharacterized protein LOC124934311 isoform X2 n=1 Tax=Impatiens glandulifera TaxID=253017 RepID=UPI001FB1272B|nr:uncharacterized protein LOC124934311 isoform X2 [Impatiens glandulifera]